MPQSTATEKSLIIIGAGIAGLATGCYARMNGYRTTIFEANFHMVGQWAGATIGISTVAVMGRNLVKKLCKQDGGRFLTTIPS